MLILDLTNREVANIDIEHENWMLNFLPTFSVIICKILSCMSCQEMIKSTVKSDFIMLALPKSENIHIFCILLLFMRITLSLSQFL